MKIKELREMTGEELAARRRELKHGLTNLRIQQATGQLENSGQIRSSRREVAKIETILSERRKAVSAGR